MNVFVTGATGFIGKHLVRRLTAEGHHVRCLVRKSSHVQPLQKLGVKLIYGDVNDLPALLDGMSGCDWLFHLANVYSMWEPDPSVFSRVNIDGTYAVMQAALECEVKKVVYVSTVAIYGQPAEAPFDESALPGPRLFSEYGRTKAEAEHIAWDLYNRRSLPLVVLYPGIVLGSGDEKASGHYIQDVIYRRVPSTIFHESVATYAHVNDLIDAMLHAAEIPETVGQKYLIGKYRLNGRDYARLIGEVSGVPLPIIHLPDWFVIAVAWLLTFIAGYTKIPPLWGLSSDAASTLKHGFLFDGSKAERELGITYTPVRLALEEAVESYRQRERKKGQASALRVSFTRK